MENQESKIQRLVNKRDELVLGRDILALELEMRELRKALDDFLNQEADGNSDTEESKS